MNEMKFQKKNYYYYYYYYYYYMELLEDLDFAEKLRKRLISKIMNIAIRCTYYIFCRRNKEWTDPYLMDF